MSILSGYYYKQVLYPAETNADFSCLAFCGLILTKSLITSASNSVSWNRHEYYNKWLDCSTVDCLSSKFPILFTSELLEVNFDRKIFTILLRQVTFTFMKSPYVKILYCSLFQSTSFKNMFIECIWLLVIEILSNSDLAFTMTIIHLTECINVGHLVCAWMWYLHFLVCHHLSLGDASSHDHKSTRITFTQPYS